MISRRLRHGALVVLLLGGAVFRITAYMEPGSLWFDELATGLNVRDREWGDILAPLAYRQVAPVGFLAGEMTGVALLGSTESGLRLFPLIASLASLVLFWRVASRYLEGIPLLAALALFAFSPALVWYARKAKQYSGDVGVVLLLLWLSLKLREARSSPERVWRTSLLVGIAGGLALLVSHPSILVALSLLLILVAQDRRLVKAIVPVAAGWLAGAALQAWTTLRLIPADTQEFMSSAWHFAFVPLPWHISDFLTWLPRRLFDFTGFFVGLLESDSEWERVFAAFYSTLAGLGLFHLIRRGRRTSAMILLAPLLAAVGAATVRFLPLSGRLMIYVGPVLAIACGLGVERLHSMARPRIRGVILSCGLGVCLAPAVFLPFLMPALSGREDARPVLIAVHDRWQIGDVMYVFPGAIEAARFYGEPLGLSPVLEGKWHRRNERAYLQDLDALRGRTRVWVFRTHTGVCRAANVEAYLGTIGRAIEVIQDPNGVSGMHKVEARLYDLSDSVLLERSTGETFPIFGRSDPRCRRGNVPVGSRIKERLLRILQGS